MADNGINHLTDEDVVVMLKYLYINSDSSEVETLGIKFQKKFVFVSTLCYVAVVTVHL